MPMGTMTQRDALLLFGAAATAAIFLWDLLTPLGMAVGLLYAPVVLLTLWLPFRRAAVSAAFFFSLLIAIGYRYGSAGPGEEFAPFNRLVSVVVLWVVALLCESWKGTSRTAAALDEQLQAVFANASVGIAITDGLGRFVRTNEAYCTLTGFAQAELRDRTFMDVAYRDDLARHVDMVGRLTRGECRGGTLETRLIRKSGAVIWVRNNVALLRDAPDRPTHILAVTEDITERKTAEQERSRLFERV
jgi:PAS domain S-box-containing protein